MKTILLCIGFMLFLLDSYVVAIQTNIQFGFFIVGIVLLGIPHGAADLLIAARNAEISQKSFSKVKFFTLYLGRLIVFGAIILLVPVVANILFIFFAAYHFGETDLHQFKTNTILGKLFITSYGMLILGVILLHHFEEVKPIYELLETANENVVFINWISDNRYYMLFGVAIVFCVLTFVYFFNNEYPKNSNKKLCIINFLVMIFILFKLPMLLGFTFYFVLWHSLLSLDKIINHLTQNNAISYKIIMQQIFLYSCLAIAGILILGFSGFMFTSNNAVAGYIFLGLALLTAPHIVIMYDMYVTIRQKVSVNS